jgi:hypothetical protein
VHHRNGNRADNRIENRAVVDLPPQGPAG